MRCGLDRALRRPTVFSTPAADAAGVPRSRLRRSDLVSAGQGLWRVRDREEEFLDRLRALQDLHPSAAFSHVTALRVLGVVLPGWWERHAAVHLSLPSHQPVGSRLPDVRVHRRGLATGVQELEGVRVTTAPSTFLDMAGAGMALEDLVVIGDAMAHDGRGARRRRERGPGVVGLDALQREVRSRAGARGVVRAREALGLVRVGADSPQETRLRLRLTAAGIPEPQVNPEVPLVTGQRLRVDLVWPDRRVAVEYDGDQHRTDPRQWREDREREASLRAEGWEVIRVTADVFRSPHWELFVRQLRLALAAPPSSTRTF